MNSSDDEGQAKPTNLQRLNSHLKNDSLAKRLVAARIATDSTGQKPALRKVIADRVEELKRKHESLPD